MCALNRVCVCRLQRVAIEYNARGPWKNPHRHHTHVKCAKPNRKRTCLLAGTQKKTYTIYNYTRRARANDTVSWSRDLPSPTHTPELRSRTDNTQKRAVHWSARTRVHRHTTWPSIRPTPPSLIYERTQKKTPPPGCPPNDATRSPSFRSSPRWPLACPQPHCVRTCECVLCYLDAHTHSRMHALMHRCTRTCIVDTHLPVSVRTAARLSCQTEIGQ